MNELPLGFAMALAQDTDTMEYFSKLSRQEQAKIINKAHNVGSEQEMHNLISNIQQTF